MILTKKYLNYEKMININGAYVMSILSKNKGLTKKQICEISGLSWGGTTKIVARLFESNYIIEEKTPLPSAGRTPSVLKINPDINYVLGIDINLSGLHMQVMDLSGDIKKEYEYKLKTANKDDFIGSIFAYVDSVFLEFDKNIFIAIGISMQGIVDRNSGLSLYFPNIPDWKNVPIKQMFYNQYNLFTTFEHDPDCLLFAYSAYHKIENTLLFRIDSSIGVSVSIENEILRKTGILEISHNIVIPNGKICKCGKKGCLESYISACTDTNGNVNPKAIQELILPLSITIENLKNIFSAKKIIISGDFIKHRSYFEKELRFSLPSIDILFWGNSNSASIGAGFIAMEESIKLLSYGNEQTVCK